MYYILNYISMVISMRNHSYNYTKQLNNPTLLHNFNNKIKEINDDINELIQIKEKYEVIYNTLSMIIEEKIKFDYLKSHLIAQNIYITFLHNIDTDKNKNLEYFSQQIPHLLNNIRNLKKDIEDYREEENLLQIKLNKIEQFRLKDSQDNSSISTKLYTI